MQDNDENNGGIIEMDSEHHKSKSIERAIARLRKMPISGNNQSLINERAMLGSGPNYEELVLPLFYFIEDDKEFMRAN